MAKKKAKKKARVAVDNNPPAAQPKPKKGPRQADLPGMEDRAIQALDDSALSYAEIRDARMKLSLEETEAKTMLLGLMHANKKSSYTHANIHIEIVPEGEKLKVKIKSEDVEEPADTSPADEEVAAAEEVEEFDEDAEVEDVEEFEDEEVVEDPVEV